MRNDQEWVIDFGKNVTMSNDLVTTDAANSALALARLQDIVDGFYRSIERDRYGVDRLPKLPTTAMRKVLDDRRRTLHARLRPISMATADQERACKAIAGFLGGYLNVRLDNPAATTAGYVAHLGDQPLFAILAAIDDFKHRRVFDVNRDGERIPFTVDHAPSAYRLLDQVKKRAADVQGEHHKVMKVLAVRHMLDAPEVSEAERERVAAHMRGLADSLAMKAEAIHVEERKRIREEAQAARDRSARIIQEAKRQRADADFASQAEQATG